MEKYKCIVISELYEDSEAVKSFCVQSSISELGGSKETVKRGNDKGEDE